MTDRIEPVRRDTEPLFAVERARRAGEEPDRRRERQPKPPPPRRRPAPAPPPDDGHPHIDTTA